MSQVFQTRGILENAKGKTALITGSARGIGGSTAVLLNERGCNIIVTDLPSLRPQAELLIQSLRYPERAIFVAANVTEWGQIVSAFKEGIRVFGSIEIVVANAGIMESRTILDVETAENGDPLESIEGNNVIDVNVKGTLNTLRLGFHYMRNQPVSESTYRGSIVLVTSTSGYFGFSGNTAYVASKHAVVGLLRASQPLAKRLRIRVNAVAPSFTPTYITAGFGNSFAKAGVESNTLEQVATAIGLAALDIGLLGTCYLLAGQYVRELEHPRKELMPSWLGQDLLGALVGFQTVVEDIGGYPLPPAAPRS